jgi:hypothetical protein
LRGWDIAWLAPAKGFLRQLIRHLQKTTRNRNRNRNRIRNPQVFPIAKWPSDSLHLATSTSLLSVVALLVRILSDAEAQTLLNFDLHVLSSSSSRACRHNKVLISVPDVQTVCESSGSTWQSEHPGRLSLFGTWHRR